MLLVGVDNPAKKLTDLLASRCFGQQVVILGKEDTAEFGGTIEQIGVVDHVGMIFIRRDNIHLA